METASRIAREKEDKHDVGRISRALRADSGSDQLCRKATLGRACQQATRIRSRIRAALRESACERFLTTGYYGV
jgi:hypothetical protein